MASFEENLEFSRGFVLGKKAGREEKLEEIAKALDLDARIAKAIAQHEQHYHGSDD